jgi:hypothetical protein
MSKKVFIIYDFNIKKGLVDKLRWVKGKAGDEFIIDYPGAVGELAQGEVWRDVVEPPLKAADRIVAYVDLPNANVGFEIGYALGISEGKEIALASVHATLPAWLTGPPFESFLCSHVSGHEKLLSLIQGDRWVKSPRRPIAGRNVLLLCPSRSGSIYAEELLELYPNWKTLPSDGWTLNDLPDLFEGIGAVIWLIVPHDGGENERDGNENAATSVVAGFAAGLGLSTRIFTHKEARVVVDVAGTALDFADTDQLLKLIGPVALDLRRQLTPVTESVTVAGPDLTVWRPKLPPAPRFNDADWLSQLFIGRERLLEDHRDSLRGLESRFRADSGNGSAAVQVAWYHGFGGMGKSWFLRMSMIETERRLPHAKAVLIDWENPQWRGGLLSPPAVPRDLTDAIARRLGQIYGVEALDPYWSAEARIERAGSDRQQLVLRVQRGLADWIRGSASVSGADSAFGVEAKDLVLKALLVEEGLWSDDQSELEQRLEAARRDPEWEPRLRRRWFEHGGGLMVNDEEAVLRPKQVLLAGFHEAVRSITRTAPLVIILDTCEILSEAMDRRLRSMVVPLCDGTCPVLFLIGSRLAPDVGERPGSRRGWKAEIGGSRWRSVPFDHDVHFTVDEVLGALDRLKRKVTERETVASHLHDITLGVPLAIRTLLDLHEDGADILNRLPDRAGDARSEVSANAIDDVIETVANRFLLHIEGKAGRETDMEDIVLLAIVPHADPELLARLWGRDRVRSRLADLARRYSLLNRV